MVSSDQLLAGPRGRRFLLRFVQACEYEAAGQSGDLPLSSAVLHTSYRIERRLGRSNSVLSSEPFTGPRLDVADVVAALPGAPLAEPTDDLLLDALKGSVDAAMYWQEPDGDDLLCAIPAVRDGLARVAEHLPVARTLGAADGPGRPTLARLGGAAVPDGSHRPAPLAQRRHLGGGARVDGPTRAGQRQRQRQLVVVPAPGTAQVDRIGAGRAAARHAPDRGHARLGRGRRHPTADRPRGSRPRDRLRRSLGAPVPRPSPRCHGQPTPRLVPDDRTRRRVGRARLVRGRRALRRHPPHDRQLPGGRHQRSPSTATARA